MKFTCTNTSVPVGRSSPTRTGTAWAIGARIFVELEEPTESSAEFGWRLGGHAQVSLRRDHTAPRSESRRLIRADTGRLMMQKQCSTRVPSANWCSISTRVESRVPAAENKPVTARAFIHFRGPKALLDIIRGRPFL